MFFEFVSHRADIILSSLSRLMDPQAVMVVNQGTTNLNPRRSPSMCMFFLAVCCANVFLNLFLSDNNNSPVVVAEQVAWLA